MFPPKIILLWFLIIPFCDCVEIINENVYKNITLENQNVIIIEDIKFVNNGEDGVNDYTYTLDPSVQKAKVTFSQDYLKYDNRTYLIKLPKVILKNERFTLEVVIVVLDELVLIDSHSTQRFIHYKGNLEYYSVYKTKNFMIVYELPEKRCEFVEIEPKIHGNKTRVSNQLFDVQPYSFFPLQIVYMNNLPFYYVTNFERKIDISHYGFIIIEETVTVVNKGYKSKQPYQPVPNYTRTKLRTLLPELAFNIKLFDGIGNNSKSQLYYSDYGTLLVFESRYELFMAWKTIYTLKYTVPAYPYLQKSDDIYVLDMVVVDDVLPNAFIKTAKTKVYLPESSRLISANITEDADVKIGDKEIITTALAPSREIVVFESFDLVNGLAPNFRVVYKRGPIHVFKPAFYIITYVESIFLFYLFVSYVKSVLVLQKS
ncbi:dolichyl-diphosphooligosaccharide--protein glycosyltransferase subunit 1-like [Onthophagus taurus]|uniref:dolichyl-diphosphooligosaccharide--protein glycosyltransferase subunit 1-like n=1 Tax=Onthophagus taurus TaxID=166361 RepID=UPI0039BE7125